MPLHSAMMQTPRRASARELVQASKTPMIALNADWYSISAGRLFCSCIPRHVCNRVSAIAQEGRNAVHTDTAEWHTQGGHTEGG